MTELSMQQKREWAKTLYLKENLTQQEIAERVGVSRITVNNWIGKNGWEMLKTSITITREEQLKSLYRQLAELNNAIMARPAGERFPTQPKPTPYPNCRTPSRRWRPKSGSRTSYPYSPTA